jgi:hypothetical protein
MGQGVRERQSSLIWVQGLVCGALVAVAMPLALMLAVLLAPTAAAAMFDRQPGRPSVRAVLLCGLSACVYPLRRLWVGEHTLAASLAILGEPGVIALTWAAAAGGWILAELAPLGLSLALEAASRARAVRLRTRRERLLEEWPRLKGD